MSFPRNTSARVTTDCVVFALGEGQLEVLLVERGRGPFVGALALPGGFLLAGETLEACARRELREETGLEDVYLEQLCTFGAPERDPRGRVVSVAYVALTHRGHAPRGGSDASAASWYAVETLPRERLAFDHTEIIDAALERLRGKVRYRPIGFELLPEVFSLGDLRRLYETLLGIELDRRNFQKKMRSFGILVDTKKTEVDGPGRPAKLYRFDKKRYRALEASGFEMWI